MAFNDLELHSVASVFNVTDNLLINRNHLQVGPEVEGSLDFYWTRN